MNWIKHYFTFISIITLLLSLQEIQSQSTLAASIQRGESIYTGYCVTCHLTNGEGIPAVFPPLAKSDYLMNNRLGSIRAIKQGMDGEVTVNGMTYNSIMSSFGLDDQEVTDVMNYILNSWGNQGAEVTLAEVRSVK